MQILLHLSSDIPQSCTCCASSCWTRGSWATCVGAVDREGVKCDEHERDVVRECDGLRGPS